MVNRSREGHDLPALPVGPRLTDFAERHAREMARAGKLFHSDMDFPWGNCAGENIGTGDSVRQVERAFMRSGDHRRNILSSCYDVMGLGVVRKDGRVWVVEDFAG